MVGAILAGGPAFSEPPASGIDRQYIDDSVRAQDDFYRHVNGKWLASTEIPADKARISALDQLVDQVRGQLRSLVENGAQPKIADLYASFMDEGRVERAGLAPLNGEFARIDALENKAGIAAVIAHFNRIGIDAPIVPQIHQDAHDPGKYVVNLVQESLSKRQWRKSNRAKSTTGIR
jgi:putative endopeptidase